MAAAEEALRLARLEPREARDLAGAAIEGGQADVEVLAVAEQALGLAAAELNELREARAHLERSVALASGAGAAVRVAEARTSLAAVAAAAGDLEAALAQLDLGLLALDGPVGARAECQRALVLQRMGRVEEALEGYRRGLDRMRAVGDALGEARVLANRGILHAYCGRPGAAEAELRKAERTYLRLGRPVDAACAHHDLGFVAARAGDLPTALRRFERAARDLARLDAPRPAALLDYCDTLLRARLIPEARDVGRRAAELLERGGMGADLAEATLLRAEAALLAGDAREARSLATQARHEFGRQGRGGWAVLARHCALRAHHAGGGRTAATLVAALRLAGELDRWGWAGPSLEARVIAARVALDLGRLPDAEAELRRASRARARGPADMRAQSWHAEALLRRARGDRRGAQRAVRTGLRVLDRHQATLAATELRAQAGAAGYELGRLGVRLALESGRPAPLLEAAERSRAGALRTRPVRPAGDAELDGYLAELRQVARQTEGAAAEARDTGPLRRRQAVLEDVVRRRSWHVGNPRLAAVPEPPRPGELTAALGSSALVELVESDGTMHAVTLVAGRCRAHPLGAAAEVAAEVESLRFAMNRAAAGRQRSRARAAVAEALSFAADRLDRLLLAPLRRVVADRPLVVVPTGALHLLPWAVLPGCRGRSVSVCPSAAQWLAASSAAARAGQAPRGALLVAGPGIPDAANEVAAVGSVQPAAAVLQGPQATAARVVRALDGAGLAHIAAHGTFRGDNPLFSSLRLADGPLMVYDLEPIARPPALVVLSSCNAGVSAVRPGDEVMGFASALLSLGTATLVASVVTVATAPTRDLMVSLHRSLAAGLRPAAALAASQAAVAGPGADPEAVSALGFVCFGA